jgi:RNA polymerase sigma factor (sigma-70 family)
MAKKVERPGKSTETQAVEQPKRTRSTRRAKSSAQDASPLLDEDLRQLLTIDLERGFIVWYSRYEAHYMKIITSKTLSVEDAGDIWGQVCLNVYNDMKKHEGDDQWFLELRIGWFATIVRNAFLHWLRDYHPERKYKAQVTQISEKDLQLPDFQPVNLIVEMVRECIEELKLKRAQQQEAILLCCIQGYSYLEAATRLQCPVGTIKSHIARGKVALKRCLEQKGVGA